MDNIAMLKLLLNKKVILLLKKKFWSVPMVEKSLMVQVIGNYLLNSTTEILILQNIADIILGQNTLLSRSEKCV